MSKTKTLTGKSSKRNTTAVAVVCSALFAPLVQWADDGSLWGWCDMDDEVRVEKHGEEWSIIYAPDEVQSWEVYRGKIPNRAHFESIVRNGEGIRDVADSLLGANEQAHVPQPKAGVERTGDK